MISIIILVLNGKLAEQYYSICYFVFPCLFHASREHLLDWSIGVTLCLNRWIDLIAIPGKKLNQTYTHNTSWVQSHVLLPQVAPALETPWPPWVEARHFTVCLRESYGSRLGQKALTVELFKHVQTVLRWKTFVRSRNISSIIMIFNVVTNSI